MAITTQPVPSILLLRLIWGKQTRITRLPTIYARLSPTHGVYDVGNVNFGRLSKRGSQKIVVSHICLHLIHWQPWQFFFMRWLLFHRSSGDGICTEPDIWSQGPDVHSRSCTRKYDLRQASSLLWSWIHQSALQFNVMYGHDNKIDFRYELKFVTCTVHVGETLDLGSIVRTR